MNSIIYFAACFVAGEISNPAQPWQRLHGNKKSPKSDGGNVQSNFADQPNRFAADDVRRRCWHGTGFSC
jgi:hypothetical protein